MAAGLYLTLVKFVENGGNSIWFVVFPTIKVY